jgi:hypothetical protein
MTPRSATPPRDRPTPRLSFSVFCVLCSVKAAVLVTVADISSDAVVGSPVKVMSGLAVLVGTELDVAAEPLCVAPRGVKRELVIAVVSNTTFELTKTEYGGKKSSMCCVLAPVEQLQVGPSAQQ